MFVYSLKLNLNSDEDVCYLFPDGAILRKPGSCQETIKCQGGISQEHTVKCNADQVTTLDKWTCTPASKADDYCKPKCDKKSPKWKQDAKNCEGWITCNNGTVIASGNCPQGQIFVEDEQTCDYRPRDFKCDRNYDICNVAQIGQKFWDEDNCHKYLVCAKSYKLKEESCPLGLYYDARSGECIKKSAVNCYKHPVPEEACGSRKLPIKDRFVMDQATCRGYFYCNTVVNKNGEQIPDESPVWNQCPLGYFFDGNAEVCRNQNYVKCVEDRCDGKQSGRVLSEMPGCQHYLECQNSMTIEEGKCPDDKYFDPVLEMCVANKVSYPICS